MKQSKNITLIVGDCFKTNTGNWIIIKAFEYEFIIVEMYDMDGNLIYDRHITYAGILLRYERMNSNTFKVLYAKV